MRLEEFKDIYVEKLKRDYRQKGNEWHAKMLCYCRKKMLEEPYEVVARKDTVLVGQLIHIGVSEITEYESKVYSRKVGDYIVYGTPDLIYDRIVELKFSVYPVKEPREHDVMQLRIYMWLIGADKGYLWYISPFGSREFEIEGGLSDAQVIELIENPKYPMWKWECSHEYCSLYPCKYVLSESYDKVKL